MNRLADYECPVHGPFEATAPHDADTVPCPLPSRYSETIVEVPEHHDNTKSRCRNSSRAAVTDMQEHDCCYVCNDAGDLAAEPCGIASPWLPSPVIGRVKVGTTRGRYEKAPTPYHLDTSELAEGMPHGEWKAKRQKVWRDLRWKQAKEQR